MSAPALPRSLECDPLRKAFRSKGGSRLCVTPTPLRWAGIACYTSARDGSIDGRIPFMPPPPERRDDPRIKVKAPVEIYLEGNTTPLRCATSDLSLHGCYIESMFPFSIGTTLELKLRLNGTLLVLAEVVTCDPQVGNGMHFTKMLAEDIEELRAYLEAAEREAAGEKETAKEDAARKDAADEAKEKEKRKNKEQEFL